MYVFNKKDYHIYILLGFIPGSAPLWPSISTTTKTYVDPHTVCILTSLTLLHLILFLFFFSTKTRQKQWMISHMNLIRTRLLSNRSSAEVHINLNYIRLYKWLRFSHTRLSIVRESSHHRSSYMCTSSSIFYVFSFFYSRRIRWCLSRQITERQFDERYSSSN